MKRLVFLSLMVIAFFLSPPFFKAQESNKKEMVFTLQFKNEKLSDCFRKIEETSEFLFAYNSSDLNEKLTVSMDFQAKSLPYIMTSLLKNSGLDFKVIGIHVSIFKKKRQVTLSGFVKDSLSSEVLIGAPVFVKNPFLATTTNVYGFYSITLAEAAYELHFTYLGQKEKILNLKLSTDTVVNVELSLPIQLTEIEIDAEEVSKKDFSSRGVSRLSIENIKKIPAPFGESDVLRMVQMQPGVQTLAETAMGYHVRGGGISQNLVLLDDAPVYNPLHLMGLISSFNPEIVKSVDFYKDGIPAGYQSGASSVLDVRGKDGNNKTYHVSGGIGFISSKLSLEGPIRIEKGSFFLAGRKSSFTENFISSGFYDLNLKLNYSLSKADRVFVSAYRGNDVFRFQSNTTLWANSTFTLRHNHIYSGKLFSNASVIFSKFNVGNHVVNNVAANGSKASQSVQNFIGKFVLSYYPQPSLSLTGGVFANDQRYSSLSYYLKNNIRNIDTSINTSLKRKALETGVFIDIKHELTKKIWYFAGIRVPFFKDKTRGTLVISNFSASKYDSVSIVPTNFLAIEPRLSITYQFHAKQMLKAGYNHINQFQQQFQGGSVNSIIQVWVPSSSILKPQTSDLFFAGYFLKQNGINYSAELYYKLLTKISDFKDGSDVLSSSFSDSPLETSIENVEAYLETGSARSCGIELSISKTEGRFTGWCNYTLADTQYRIDSINNGKPYPPNFDNKHSISAGLGFQLSTKWEITSTFSFKSGRAFTFPDSYYQFLGRQYALITERNKERTPSYHRLDVSLVFKPETRKKKFQSTWALSIINVYNRFNPAYYTIDNGVISGHALFPFFPSLSYSFKY